MREAFTYMFKDNRLLSKAVPISAQFLCIFALCFVSLLTSSQFLTMLTVLLIIFTIVSIFGYFITTVKAIILQNSNIVLPALKPINNFTLGFKSGIAVFFAELVIDLFAVSLHYIVSLLPNKKISLLLSLFILGLYILIYMLKPALICIYAKTEKFFSYLNFKLAFKLISKNIKNYILAVLIYFVSLITLTFPVNYMNSHIKELPLYVSVIIYTVALIILPLFIYIQAYACAKSINKECLEEL